MGKTNERELEITKKRVMQTIESWLAANPADFMALRWAMQYFDEEEARNALESAKTALEGSRNGLWANLLLGEHYFYNRKYKAAAAELENVDLSCWLDDDSYYNLLGITYYHIGSKADSPEDALEHFEKAAKYFKKAIEYAPGITLRYINFFNTFARLNEKNLECIKEVAAKAPEIVKKNPDYQNQLGYIYFYAGKYDDSIPYYEAAVKLAPESHRDLVDFYANLVNAYIKSNNLQKAVDVTAKAPEIVKKNPDYQNRLGNIYIGAGKYDDSIPYYEEAVKLAPESYPNLAVFYINLVDAYGSAGKHDKVKENHTKAPEIVKKNPDYQNQLGYIYFYAGKYDDSIPYYEAAVKLAPESHRDLVDFYANLVNAYIKSNNLQKAVDVTAKAPEIVKKNPDYQNRLGNIYIGAGKYDDSIPYYEEAVKLAPESYPNLAVFYINLVSAYESAGKLNEVKENHAKAPEIVKKNPDYQNKLGNIYFCAGKCDDSIPYYEAAVKLAPESHPNLTVFYMNLVRACAYIESSNLQKVEDIIAKAPEVVRNDFNYQSMLGEMYFKKYKNEQAIRHYMRAVELEPEDAEAWFNLGSVYAREEEWQEANKYFEKAVELNNSVPEYLEALERVKEELGKI